MRNVYSGAGAKPNTLPVPKSNGLIYSEPCPTGGTCTIIEAQTCLDISCIYKQKEEESERVSGKIPNACWQGQSALLHEQIVQQMVMACTFSLPLSLCVEHSLLV